MPPRLLVISTMRPSPEAPQFGIFVQRQVEALRELGAEVELVAVPRSGSGPVRTPLKYLRLAHAARRAARRGRFDAVVAHYLFPGGAIGRRIARRRGIPLIAVAHGTDVANVERSARLRRLTAPVLRDAAAVVAVSQALGDRLRAVIPFAAPLEAIDVGVDTSRFRPGDREVAAHALGPPADGPVIVCVGNLVAAKNLERLADAVGSLRAARPGAVLVLAGDGPLAGVLGERPEVRLLGAVAPDEVPRLLRAADACALVSLSEGYGLAALEALACGVPVVVSERIPVAVEIPPTAGVRVDPASAAAIAAGLEAALALGRDDPAGLAVAAEHDVHRQAERLLALVAATRRR